MPLDPIHTCPVWCANVSFMFIKVVVNPLHIPSDMTGLRQAGTGHGAHRALAQWAGATGSHVLVGPKASGLLFEPVPLTWALRDWPASNLV